MLIKRISRLLNTCEKEQEKLSREGSIQEAAGGRLLWGNKKERGETLQREYTA